MESSVYPSDSYRIPGLASVEKVWRRYNNSNKAKGAGTQAIEGRKNKKSPRTMFQILLAMSYATCIMCIMSLVALNIAILFCFYGASGWASWEESKILREPMKDPDHSFLLFRYLYLCFQCISWLWQNNWDNQFKNRKHLCLDSQLQRSQFMLGWQHCFWSFVEIEHKAGDMWQRRSFPFMVVNGKNKRTGFEWPIQGHNCSNQTFFHYAPFLEVQPTPKRAASCRLTLQHMNLCGTS